MPWRPCEPAPGCRHGRAGQGQRRGAHGAGRGRPHGRAGAGAETSWCARTPPGARSWCCGPTGRPGSRWTWAPSAPTCATWRSWRPRRGVMAVLKADAYGHGAVQVAHTALQQRRPMVRRGLPVRGPRPCAAPASTPRSWCWATPRPGRRARRCASDLSRGRVRRRHGAAALGRAAVALRATGARAREGRHRHAPAWVWRRQEAPAFLAHLSRLPGLEVEGLFTHLPRRRRRSSAAARGRRRGASWRAFDALVARLEARWPAAAAGARRQQRGLAHAACRRATTWCGRASRCTGWRRRRPSRRRSRRLRPALTWKTQVAQVRDLARGRGGGLRRRLARGRPPPRGHDPGGLRRRLPARAARPGATCWCAAGRRRWWAGCRWTSRRSTSPTSPACGKGDEVVLIGRQGGAEITAETVAEWLGTINYEVVAGISGARAAGELEGVAAGRGSLAPAPTAALNGQAPGWPAAAVCNMLVRGRSRTGSS